MEIIESSDRFTIIDKRKDWRINLAFVELIAFLSLPAYQIATKQTIDLPYILGFSVALLLMIPLIDGFYSFVLPKTITIEGGKNKPSINLQKEYFFGRTTKQLVNFQDVKSLKLNILWELRPTYFLKRFFFRLKIVKKNHEDINIDFSPINEFDNNSEKIVDISYRISETYGIPLHYNPKPISALRRLINSQK